MKSFGVDDQNTNKPKHQTTSYFLHCQNNQNEQNRQSAQPTRSKTNKRYNIYSSNLQRNP